MDTWLSEKTDTWNIGTMLFFILTAKRPYSLAGKPTNDAVRQLIVNGVRPELPPDIAGSDDVAIRAMVTEMYHALEYDPRTRRDAHQIYKNLAQAVEQISKTDTS
uniref:Protein kinase domain-containing protein n=2 Tax=Corethron hystrix TaxID=216773 RepID=A0A7S1BD00_9STRA